MGQEQANSDSNVPIRNGKPDSYRYIWGRNRQISIVTYL